jgi:alkylation response protein AidB-like acyl-CoA dehydrogenase
MLLLTPPSVAIGIAEGALDTLVRLARTGRRQMRAPTAMRDSELFRYELGRAAAEIRTARLALETQAKLHWEHAQAGTLRTEARLVEGHQVGVQVAATCRHAVETCFKLGGGSAVYLDSPLQRRFRDIMALGQHAAVQERQFATFGAALLAAEDAKAPAVEETDPKVARLRA